METPWNYQLSTKSPSWNRTNNYFSRTKATYLWAFSRSWKHKTFRRSQSNRSHQSNLKKWKYNRSQAFSRLCRARVKLFHKSQVNLHKLNQCLRSLIFSKPRHKLKANLHYSVKMMSLKFCRIKFSNNKLESSINHPRTTSQRWFLRQLPPKILKNIMKIS